MLECRSLALSPEARNHTAYHEAGHVLVSEYTVGSTPVQKVTIVPHGQALGMAVAVRLCLFHCSSAMHPAMRCLLCAIGKPVAQTSPEQARYDIVPLDCLLSKQTMIMFSASQRKTPEPRFP